MRPTAFHLGATLLLLASAISAQTPVITGTDLHGHQLPLLSPTRHLAVLFFIASDCPISNRYQPEMQRVERAYSPRGVAVWFVYPNLTETTQGIAAHQSAFDGGSSQTHILTDPTQQLTRLAGANVTPEAAILESDHHGTVHAIYAGRIDDRYLSIGNERPQATHHDLELALNAALAHQPIPQPTGPPVGCGVVSTR